MRDRTLYHLLLVVGREIHDAESDQDFRLLLSQAISTLKVSELEGRLVVRCELGREDVRVDIDEEMFRFHIRNDAPVFVAKNESFRDWQTKNHENAVRVWKSIFSSAPLVRSESQRKEVRKFSSKPILVLLRSPISPIFVFLALLFAWQRNYELLVVGLIPLVTFWGQWNSASPIAIAASGACLLLVEWTDPHWQSTVAVLALAILWKILTKRALTRYRYFAITIGSLAISLINSSAVALGLFAALFCMLFSLHVEVRPIGKPFLAVCLAAIVGQAGYLLLNRHSFDIEVPIETGLVVGLAVLTAILQVLFGRSSSSIGWIVSVLAAGYLVFDPTAIAATVSALVSQTVLVLDCPPRNFLVVPTRKATKPTTEVAVSVRTPGQLK